MGVHILILAVVAFTSIQSCSQLDTFFEKDSEKQETDLDEGTGQPADIILKETLNFLSLLENVQNLGFSTKQAMSDSAKTRSSEPQSAILRDSLEVVTVRAQLLDERQERTAQEKIYISNIEKLKTQIDSLENVLSLVSANEESRGLIDTTRADRAIEPPDTFIADADTVENNDYTTETDQKELYSGTQAAEPANSEKADTHEKERSFLWLLYALLTLIVVAIIYFIGRLLFSKHERGQPGGNSGNPKGGKDSHSHTSYLPDISTTDKKLPERSMGDEKDNQSKVNKSDERSMPDTTDHKAKVDDSDERSMPDVTDHKAKVENSDQRSMPDATEVSTKESKSSEKRMPSYSVPEHSRKIESKKSKTLPKPNTENRLSKTDDAPISSEAIPEHTITIVSPLRGSEPYSKTSELSLNKAPQTQQPSKGKKSLFSWLFKKK